VLTQSAIRGRLAGWIITLGLCTGLIGHTLLVSSGVAVIFKTSPVAFTSLKLAGGAYLFYLAFLAFRTSAAKLSPFENVGTSLLQLYLRGIIMNMTNPKVSIFFLSFLPQFVNPEKGLIMLQIIALGFVFIFSALIVFGMISLFAGFLGEHLQRSPKTQNIMNRIAAMVYAALAMKLISSEI